MKILRKVGSVKKSDAATISGIKHSLYAVKNTVEDIYAECMETKQTDDGVQHLESIRLSTICKYILKELKEI